MGNWQFGGGGVSCERLFFLPFLLLRTWNFYVFFCVAVNSGVQPLFVMKMMDNKISFGGLFCHTGPAMF